jgi:hypothetical protein
LLARLGKIEHRLCDPECEGRCKLCPLEVIRDVRAFLAAKPSNEVREALEALDLVLDFSDENLEPVWTFDDLTSVKAAFALAHKALAAPVPPAEGAQQQRTAMMLARSGTGAAEPGAQGPEKLANDAIPPVRGEREAAGIARSLETIENAYNFVSEAGPLKNCGEWKYLKRLLSLPVQPGAGERVSFPRHWIEQIRDGLFAMEKLPSGPLGDWAFLFREQLNDALARQPQPSSSEEGR